MLYTKFVRTYTHTHTKATYDVHTVFSVHVCNSFIHCITCCITVWLFIFPFYFQMFLFGLHKQYTQLMSIASHWNTIFHWNMTYWHMLPGYSTSTCIHQVYTAYYWNSNISLDYYHVDGTQRYTRLTSFHYCMIVPWCLPLLLHSYSVHRVHIACVDIVTLVLCIRNIYIWYIYGIHLP